jgi:hypothetical protein
MGVAVARREMFVPNPCLPCRNFVKPVPLNTPGGGVGEWGRYPLRVRSGEGVRRQLYQRAVTLTLPLATATPLYPQSCGS